MIGLYIAMILEALDIPGLKYEILEGSDRVGGRVYTKYFEPEEGKPKSKHDYYDVCDSFHILLFWWLKLETGWSNALS